MPGRWDGDQVWLWRAPVWPREGEGGPSTPVVRTHQGTEHPGADSVGKPRLKARQSTEGGTQGYVWAHPGAEAGVLCYGGSGQPLGP